MKFDLSFDGSTFTIVKTIGKSIFVSEHRLSKNTIDAKFINDMAVEVKKLIKDFSFNMKCGVVPELVLYTALNLTTIVGDGEMLYVNINYCDTMLKICLLDEDSFIILPKVVTPTSQVDVSKTIHSFFDVFFKCQ